jgi:hypothetical protein
MVNEGALSQARTIVRYAPEMADRVLELEVLSRSAADQSASTYPASEVSSQPRWRCRAPGVDIGLGGALINDHGATERPT